MAEPIECGGRGHVFTSTWTSSTTLGAALGGPGGRTATKPARRSSRRATPQRPMDSGFLGGIPEPDLRRRGPLARRSILVAPTTNQSPFSRGGERARNVQSPSPGPAAF